MHKQLTQSRCSDPSIGGPLLVTVPHSTFIYTLCAPDTEGRWSAADQERNFIWKSFPDIPTLMIRQSCGWQRRECTTQIWVASESTQNVPKYVEWADNAENFCTPSFYQIKPPATLPCKNLRTPDLFQNVLMRVSQILVVHWSSIAVKIISIITSFTVLQSISNQL